MNKTLIKKYAKLVASQGIGLKKNQQVCIYAPISASFFVEILVEELYKNKASKVLVEWTDSTITKAKYKYESVDTLSEVPLYIEERAKYFYNNKIARISISSSDPDGLKGLDFNKLKIANKATSYLDKYLSDPYMASLVQWCVVAVPNIKWAKKVFPNLSNSKAMDALWDAILKANHISKDNNPVDIWKEHDKNLHEKADLLNKYNFKSLKYKSSNGTDFEIGLVNNHIWAGGSEQSEAGLFNPNMPTEEIFTMPHKYKVNGKVVSTKPLLYQGNIIEDFYLVFKDGKVVEAVAKKNQEALDALLNVDEGSRYLGEVALVPYHSPISELNILFYNTLFDENASCHLALGRAYSMNIVGGITASEEKLKEQGYNHSLIHVDFMIGTKDLSIIGIDQDNKEIAIFDDGDFVI